MGPLKPAIATDGFAVRLAAFYAALFVTLGIQMPFLPVWLAAKGLDANAIGVVLAAPLVLRMVTVPLATGAADQRGAWRGTLIIATTLATAGYALLGLTQGFWPILAVMALASAGFTSTFPLIDAYALKGLAERAQSYGSVRLWGSGAFILGSLAAGSVANLIPATDLIWLIVAACGLMVAASISLQPMATAAPVRRRGAGLVLLGSPAFLLVAGAASLIQASHALYYGFSTLEWAAAGFGGTAIGALWAIGVVAEILLFAISGRLPAAFDPPALLTLGAAGAVLRWSMMALDPPAIILPLLQCLHGLSFGATHLGAVQFLARTAPQGLGATAQGYLAIVLGTVMAAFMGLSGVLFGAYGGRAYAVMALAAMMGGVLALAARRQWRGDAAA